MFEHLKSGQLVEDADRRVALVNPAFCEMFEIPATPEQLVGSDCAAAAEGVKSLFIDPGAFLASTLRAVHTREPIHAERLALLDGRVLERDYTAAWADGVFAGHIWTYRDVTATHHALYENARLRSFYEQVLGSMPAQVAVFDTECRFLYVNHASIADPEVRAWAIGRTNEDYCVYRGVPVAIGEARSATIRAVIESGKADYFEETFERHGERRVIERSVAPIFDTEGRVVQAIGFGRDFTVMRRAQEALAESEERLRLALQGANLGTWDLDLRTDELSLSARSLELFGYATGDIAPTLEAWSALLHPEDAPSTLAT